MIVRHGKEQRYAKLSTLLKEFECLETKSNARILNLKHSKNWRGKIALIRTHEIKLAAHLQKLIEKTYMKLKHGKTSLTV